MKNLILCLLSIFVFSCSTSSNKENEELIIPTVSELNRLVDNSELKSEDYIDRIETTIKVKAIEKKLLNESFLKLNNNSIDIQTVVLFSNNENIIGLGIYSFSEAKENYYLDLYKFQETFNKFEKTNSYLTNLLLIKELLVLKQIYFQNSDIDLLYVENYTEHVPKSNYSDLTLAIKMEKIKDNSNNNEGIIYRFSDPYIDDGGGACGIVGNCLRGGAACCASPAFVCQDCPECPKDELEISAARLGYSTSNILFDNKYYDFRDSFLLNSQLGNKYIDLYYGSSTHFSEALDTNIIVKLLNVFPEMNEAIDNLKNSQYNGVIISEELKSDILSITNDLKKNTSSAQYKSILDIFESDLEKFSLKSRSEINNLINDN